MKKIMIPDYQYIENTDKKTSIMKKIKKDAKKLGYVILEK